MILERKRGEDEVSDGMKKGLSNAIDILNYNKIQSPRQGKRKNHEN